MYAFISLIIFFTGASFGSFLNVLIDRLPRGESVVKVRSRCESCNKKLPPQDLIPIISFLTLSGRCRYCHAKIPARILLVEVLSGLIALIIAFYALSVDLPLLPATFLFIVVLCFMGIFFSDFAYGIIPDEFTAAIVFSTTILLILEKPGLISQHFLTGAISFLLFFALYSLTRGAGMGLGDVKLAFAIGFFLGFPNIIVGTYVAFLTAMFVSIILILMGRKKIRGSTIAFGPFLSIGAVVAYFFGARILDLFL